MRALLAIVLFVCAAAGAWLLVGSAREPEQNVFPAEARSASPVANAPLPASTHAPQAHDTAATQRVEVAATPTAPVLDVRVVAFGTGLPVAGAVVHYQPPDLDWGQDTSELQTLANTDIEAFLHRVGRSVVADAAGRCSVPAGPHGTALTARAGALFGSSFRQPGAPAPHTIAVRPDHALRVRVMDAAGQPLAGVTIMARTVAGGTTDSWSLGQTNAEGRLHQQHVQSFARDAQTRPVALGAQWIGTECPEVTVDLASPPQHEVELRLPPMGTVTVHALDAAGAPVDPRYLSHAEVWLALLPHKPTDRGAELRAFNGGQNLRARLDARGTARFPQVGLDRYLVLRLGHAFEAQGLAGPTAAMPHLETTLRLSAEGAVIVGRLIGPEGTPLPSRSFQVTYRGGRGMGSNNAPTDAEGRFRIHLGNFAVGDEVVITIVAGAAKVHGGPVTLELPPRAMQKGVNDLGDVLLAAPRPLVTGRLVSDPGVEVRQVALRIERRHGQGWRDDGLRAEWEQEGRFTVKGAGLAGTPLRLVVPAGPYLPVAAIECTSGGPPVEIRLRAAAEATAVFLVDDQTPWNKLHFRFLPAAEKDRFRRDAHDRGAFGAAPADGVLRRTWTGLVPSAYQLTVVCPGVDQAVVNIDNLQVDTGPCTDPRLSGIDLRGRTRTVRVRVTDDNGGALTAAKGHVVVRSSGDDWFAFPLLQGEVDLTTPAPLDLLVLAAGYRWAEARVAQEDITVPLARAPEAQLRVETPGALPEGAVLRLRLDPLLGFPAHARLWFDAGAGGARLLDFLAQTLQVGPLGAVRASVRHPGACRATASLTVHGNRTTQTLPVEPDSLDLGGAGREAVKIRIPAAEWERAVEALRK